MSTYVLLRVKINKSQCNATLHILSVSYNRIQISIKICELLFRSMFYSLMQIQSTASLIDSKGETQRRIYPLRQSWYAF